MTRMDRVRQEPFSGEERYIVVKREHLTTVMEGAILSQLAALEVPTLECVVVESDWPEYERVRGMIEDGATGRAASGREQSSESPKIPAAKTQPRRRDLEPEKAASEKRPPARRTVRIDLNTVPSAMETLAASWRKSDGKS